MFQSLASLPDVSRHRFKACAAALAVIGLAGPVAAEQAQTPPRQPMPAGTPLPPLTHFSPYSPYPELWTVRPQPTFPEAAVREGLTTGSVTLICGSAPEGILRDCTVYSESPEGLGFGVAAVSAMRFARLNPVRLTRPGPYRFTLIINLQ